MKKIPHSKRGISELFNRSRHHPRLNERSSNAISTLNFHRTQSRSAGRCCVILTIKQCPRSVPHSTSPPLASLDLGMISARTMSLSHALPTGRIINERGNAHLRGQKAKTFRSRNERTPPALAPAFNGG